jgi:glucose-1-phosphate adenylyltransferase
VNEGAVIEDSVVMDFTAVGKGVHLRRVIVDRFNILGSGLEVGVNPKEDRLAYHVEPSGLVVIPRGGRRDFFLDDQP